jgi:DNA-binding LytR/AlgR family response regulator
MTVSILIADDDEAARGLLVSALRAVWHDLDAVHEATNGVDAWDLFLEHEPRACWLDVRMPGMTGIDVAERIGGRVPVVFLVTPGDPALQAFADEGVDHVRKPLRDEALPEVVGRVRERLGTRPEVPPVVPWLAGRLASQVRRPAPVEALPIGAGPTAPTLRVDDVVFFEADGRSTRAVRCDGSEATVRIALKDLVALLDGQRFCQIHRGLVVGRRHIADALTDGGDMVLTLRGRAERLPVARHFQPQFGARPDGLARSAA